MAYTALYRKWRPSTFDEVRGQEHIVRTLKNQIITDRIGHAYLFCGTRGTGKTSIAKIFAKTVNCEHPKDGNPCGECAMCRAIAEGASLNVIEIDAASNNGVDDVREIRNQVQYPPTDGKYKVFIIDEVHMLSAGAFNALLKTLEEPPEYVIFILATTEVNKIPITILSRCQRYDFRRISIDTIAGHLRELADAEGIDADDKALRYVARVADGSMRDSLSLLDQCAAFHFDEKLTYDNVLDVLGAVDTGVFTRLFDAVVRSDTAECLRTVSEMVAEGRELTQMVTDFLWYMRNVLIIRNASEDDRLEDMVEMSEDNAKVLREQAQHVDEETLMRYIRVLSELSGQMKFATQKRVLVEIALIRLTRPAMENNLDSVLQRLAELEKKMSEIPSGADLAAAAAAAAQQGGTAGPAAGIAAAPSAPKEPKKVTLPQAEYEELKLIREEWPMVVGKAGGSIRSALRDSFVNPISPGRMEIIVPDQMNAKMLERLDAFQQISDIIAEDYQREIRFTARGDGSVKQEDTVYVSSEDLQAAINFPITEED